MKYAESIKITIRLQRRRDGGLRAWSDDVPGLVLSHSDPERVLADIIPAVEAIMSELLGAAVVASELKPASSIMTPVRRRKPTLAERLYAIISHVSEHEHTREYVAAACYA